MCHTSEFKDSVGLIVRRNKFRNNWSRMRSTGYSLHQVAATGCGGGLHHLCHKGSSTCRDRIDYDRLLHHPVEELAAVFRASPVEPEGEFVKIEFQVLMADRSLVGAQHPAFQQRRNQVDTRQQFRRGFILVPTQPFQHRRVRTTMAGVAATHRRVNRRGKRSRRRKYGNHKNRFPHFRRHDDCEMK